MKATEAIRAIMKAKGEKICTLADRLKIRGNVLTVRLTQENISVSLLEPMARMLDYKIVLVPRETRESEGWYRVE